MKFDFIIGNPPYQEENTGDNNFSPPVYHDFIDEVYKLADCAELIHPARFLFNAGATPKEWNRKMLNDQHLKVLFYEPLSSKIFPTKVIKGGIAITYHDNKKNFGKIGIFTSFVELNSIIHKVKGSLGFQPINRIMYSAFEASFTKELHTDYPNAKNKLSEGHLYDISSNIFERLPEIFYEKKPNDQEEYVQIIGLEKNKRAFKWIKRKYVNETSNFAYYKVFVPKSNGSGALGEVLSTPLIGQPLIGQPLIGHTQSFIVIGKFDTELEASSALKYIKSKFARVMLGVLKITQDNPPGKWQYVPLQDFTEKSDIDWSKSIAEIDRQLYKKYGLDDKEITFIETHVKEMS